MSLATTSPVSWTLCPPRFGTPRRPERKTLGPQVGLIAEAIGKPLMPWQQHVADVALEVDPHTGRFAYREVVLTVPRRSGKSLLLLALLVQRMVAMGRPQVAAFTMQNALQARLRMRREWDAEILSRSSLSTAYRFTGQPGAEALLFNNGSRIEVTASTKSSGHGLTLDLAVVDEAFDQPDDRLEQAFRPAIRTQPDAQLWWVSTAGGPGDVWFRAKVEGARAGRDSDRGTAVFDWSAPDDADPGDPAVWWACMPALGYVRPDGSGLTEQDIREEYLSAVRGDSLDGFCRAYLNQWVSKKSTSAIDPAAWAALHGSPPQPSSMTFALDVAPDHTSATIAAAWSTPTGSWVQVAAHGPGVDWVAERWRELQAKHGGRLVVEKTGTAGFLLPQLAGADEVSRRFFADACSTLDAAVTAGSLRHGSGDVLNAAVGVARWSSSGEAGQRVLSRKNSQVSPLVAAALALHGLQAQPTTGGWVFAL